MSFYILLDWSVNMLTCSPQYKCTAGFPPHQFCCHRLTGLNLPVWIYRLVSFSDQLTLLASTPSSPLCPSCPPSPWAIAPAWSLLRWRRSSLARCKEGRDLIIHYHSLPPSVITMNLVLLYNCTFLVFLSLKILLCIMSDIFYIITFWKYVYGKFS